MIGRKFDSNLLAWRLEGDPGPSHKETGPIRWSVSEQQKLDLMKLATGHSVIEIGTGCGVATEAMAETAETVHTFDVDPTVTLEPNIVGKGSTGPASGIDFDSVDATNTIISPWRNDGF